MKHGVIIYLTKRTYRKISGLVLFDKVIDDCGDDAEENSSYGPESFFTGTG